MFLREEYVFHELEGICKIVDIQVAPLEGMPADRRYYIITPLQNSNSVIYVPVDSDRVFLRRLLSRAEAEELLDRIPFVRVIDENNPKLLRAKYQEAMGKHDPVEWVRVIKTAYLRVNTLASRSRSARISDTERFYSENAKRFLHAELALSLGLSSDVDMERYITEHIQKMA
ncbi:MAG: CarD family transcriptional regulator [Clostridia bacterium]|nr:CarD family transcriptional regulator [Clostridia bacterium]